MRSSDWSSDVCSSDLGEVEKTDALLHQAARAIDHAAQRHIRAGVDDAAGSAEGDAVRKGAAAGDGEHAAQEVDIAGAERARAGDFERAAIDDHAAGKAVVAAERETAAQIGRASGRERGCRYV